MPQAGTPQATPAPPVTSANASANLALKRAELRDQLNELAARRNQLLAQRSGATLQKTAELDGRIALIDTRTAQLEQQLFATNDMITRGLTDGSAVVQTNTDQAIRDATRSATREAARSATLGIVAVLALFMVWRGARNFFRRNRRAEALPGNSTQLAQLQQSIDAIALEVERISEAQRYTAKLMNERGLAAGEARPVAAPNRESAGAKPGQ